MTREVRHDEAEAAPLDGVLAHRSVETDAHRSLRARVRGWVAEHLEPHVDAWEEQGAFPRDVYAAAGEAGLFGHKVAPAHGGSGPDLVADAIVAEELAACWSGGVAAGLGAHKDLGSYYLYRFGTDEQRARWVAPAVAGATVTALAVTEPAAGSDVAGLRARATPQPGGDWLLDGTKTFITNGTWADQVVVAALTDPDETEGPAPSRGHRGLSLFVVETGDPGFTRRRIPTLGWRPSQTGELSFADVRLPADRLLGGPEMRGHGFVCIMRNFQWERIVMALGACRASEELLRLAARRLADRRGSPSGEGAWRHRLADAAADVAAARSLTDQALRLHVVGRDALREVSMAKGYACEVAVRTAEEVLQLCGWAGLRSGERVERALRDARLGPIGGGTTQIMREVVARTLAL